MRNRILALTLVVVLLSACAAGRAAYQEVVVENSAPMAKSYSDEFAYTEPEESIAVASSEVGGLTTQEIHTRMVIKNASLSIVVEEPGATMDSISKLATELGGFVVNSNLYRIQVDGGIEVPQANITIRVPVDTLDQALAAIKSGAGEVLNESISGQDVTQEYTDLASRLRNLENTERQLAEIMEKARETEDVLRVYNEVVAVREQIELIKGQMQYYEQSAALSAISIDIQANEAVQPLKIGGWQPVGVAKNAIQALINTLEVIANILIWIGLYVLPVILVLYFPVRWIWKGLKRLFSRRREKKEQKKALKEQTD